MPPTTLLRLPSLRPASASSVIRNGLPVCLRAFTTTGIGLAKQLPPRRVILDSEIEESFLKGSGPGGQKINKTSSAVQLKHLPTGIVIKCQESRSRSYNRKAARRILGERIEEIELGEQSRTAIKAREKSKKKASAEKKKRRKYKELAEAKAREDVEEDVEGEVEEGAIEHEVQAERLPAEEGSKGG
ncbi:RF-1 domain-containing protein [Lophiotrema nucula]|uniref:RF-1 domain-containing protein n=1 Tax=Lophiotrema nucula TaxID=690887 RepID=A0A6A5ZK05_9PLEO|nr:RF-1 domain-containing protein [Lophiotrema nucula]